MNKWKRIPSHPNYEVSDKGCVRRLVAARGTFVGKPVTQHLQNCGYLFVCLWSGNKAKTCLVHRVVAEAWIGECPSGYEVNHKDGNKMNCAKENLEYVSRSQNLLHRSGLGICRGENNHQAKLSESDVISIRERNKNGEGYKRIAKEYGVTWETIRDVIKRKSWKWLA